MAKLISKRNIIVIVVISITYILLAVYLMNFSFVKDTLIGNYPLEYKASIMKDLLGSLWTAVPIQGILVLFATAILTGIDLTIVINRLYTLRGKGKIEWLAGSGVLFGFIGPGCAACGLPVLSLVGLGGSIAYLPFRGAEISYIALLLLIISLVFLLRQDTKEKECKIT